MRTPADLRFLARYPVEFALGAEPGQATFVFSAPTGYDDMRVEPADALAVLTYAPRDDAAHSSVVAWSTAALVALRIMARGRSVGSDEAQLRSAAYALPHEPDVAHAYLEDFLASLSLQAPPREDPRASARHALRRQLERHHVAVPPIPLGLHVRLAEHNDGTVARVSIWLHPEGPTHSVTTAQEIWADHDHSLRSRREEVLDRLADLASGWPAAALIADAIAGDGARIDATDLTQLSSPTVGGLLKAAKIKVFWPREVVRELTLRPVMRARATTSAREATFGGGQVFEFDWRIALGGAPLSEADLDDLIAANHGLVRLRDEWVMVDPGTIAAARLRTAFTLSPSDAAVALTAGTVTVDGAPYDFDTDGWLDDVRLRLTGRPATEPIAAPAALAGTLRDYQLEGLRWLDDMTGVGLGVCLADDMGLGKTITLIALHLHRNARTTSSSPTLVVCPASVVGNWEREIRRFAPAENVRRFHGPGRTLDGVSSGFVLTTYGTMRVDAERLAAAEAGWGLIAADEAQQIKNPHASTARALRTIAADARVALTGTPVENNLTELWSILSWTTPGLLGSLEQFRARWARQIERYNDSRRAGELATLIKPFVLRRRKCDPGIAPELPPKTDTDHRVHLTREQVGLYETVVGEALAKIEVASSIERRGLIIGLLMRCKQICNHPAQFLHEYDTPIVGRSGKLPVLDDLLETIVAEGGAALVFTQYVQLGTLLTRHLADRGIAHRFLHGGTSLRARERMVDEFQRGDIPVFVLSLKAAGVGLNLTRADHVIHFDRWWNPAVEDQATDRAYRIGQTKPVQVHRLISAGTVEESIADLIASKRELADTVVNGAEGALTELSNADVAALVRLRR